MISSFLRIILVNDTCIHIRRLSVKGTELQFQVMACPRQCEVQIVTSYLLTACSSSKSSVLAILLEIQHVPP